MAQIMAVTGHKSASSVAVYQRVSSKGKQVMGDIITSSVRGEQPSQLSSMMPPHSTSHKGKSCSIFLNQHNFICSKFNKLYNYNINILHNKTTGL
jgi:hypothetical protein